MLWFRHIGLTGSILALVFAFLFAAQAISADYIVGIDDVLRISFWQQPDLDTVARVRRDGGISLPVVGDIQAAGLTIDQLEETIIQKISIFNTEISQAQVEILEFNSQKVFVTGEVYRPGKYTFEYIPNLWEIIREAGGPRERALLTEVSIIRADQEMGGKITVNLAEALETGDFSDLPDLKPGDTVMVPGLPSETAGASMDLLGRSVVFVYGQIVRPGVYPIEENSTLLQAITQAGGTTENADLRNVRVLIRQGQRSSLVKVDMDKHIRMADPPDFVLHPGDTVVVPKRAGLWRGLWGGFTQIMGVTSGILGIIYIVDRLTE
jgi:polysaccharide export outer membrane protein